MSEQPDEYTSDDGALHVMAACGHYVSGGVAPGERVAVCPNCELTLRAKGEVELPRPDRLPAQLEWTSKS